MIWKRFSRQQLDGEKQQLFGMLGLLDGKARQLDGIVVPLDGTAQEVNGKRG